MKIAICPGSFDPVTKGHVDVITRTAKMFDKVIVVVMINYHKPERAFTAEERVELLKRCTAGLKNVEIDLYSGLLADYARIHNAVAVVKGLRAVSDFEYEFQLASMNRRLAPEIETIFLTPAEQYAYISSSLVREIAALGGDVSEFVHPVVQRALRATFR